MYKKNLYNKQRFHHFLVSPLKVDLIVMMDHRVTCYDMIHALMSLTHEKLRKPNNNYIIVLKII